MENDTTVSLLTEVWASLRGSRARLATFTVRGGGSLPSEFPVTELATTSNGAAALAAPGPAGPNRSHPAAVSGAARDQSAALLQHLAAHGVQATGLYRLRFVTHLDVDAAGVDDAVAVIRQFFNS